MMLFTSNRHGLRKLRLKTPTVFCLPGFHVDSAWQRTQAETIEHCFSLVRQMLLACRADPYYGVYLSEIDYLKPYLDLFPEERAWVMQLIQQERCAAGGGYNQPNETSIAGEALIRNILMGVHYHKASLGYETLVQMAWDSFGHIPQFPQILKGCGIEASIFTHTNYCDPSIHVPGIPPLFCWYAPNGSSIFARRIQYSLDAAISLPEYAAKQLETWQSQFPSFPAELVIDAADMRPPRTQLLGHCRELSEQDPALIFIGAAATRYFSSVQTTVAAKKLQLEPVTRDMSQYNEGCELSRMDLKQANRVLENSLTETEIWGSIASLHGWAYPSSELDYAWRQLAFCQNHGAITGCGSDLVFVDLLDIYRDALETVLNLKTKILNDITSQIAVSPGKGDSSVLIFHSLPWQHSGIVHHWIEAPSDHESTEILDEEGEPLPFEIERVESKPDGSGDRMLAVWLESNLPSTGYLRREFNKRDEISMPFLTEIQSQSWIENEMLRVEVDPGRGGGIVSLIEKGSGKEFMNTDHAQPGNQVVLLKEGEGEEPACHLLTTGEKHFASDTPAEVKTYEGPVSIRLMIRGQGPGPCKRIQEICLYRGEPYIDCTTILENYRGHGNTYPAGSASLRDFYALMFPLDLPGSLPILEDRFYAKAYRRSQGNLHFHSTAQEWDSGHAMNSCHRWVDVSWSLLVRFMEGKEEVGNLAIGPSEVVTPAGRYADIKKRLMLYLARHGVTCSPRSDTEDIGKDRLFRSCSFSLGTADENSYTHWLLEQHLKAEEFYKRNMEDFGFAVLVVNDPSGGVNRPVFIFSGKTDALAVQTVEEMIQATIAHRWECPRSACFIKELPTVEDFGFAMFNQGTGLCSLEADGSLVTALMHTAPYANAQTPWSYEFAEQKTHVFHYRLWPHRGDWRHAEIPRRAMEYNHPVSTRFVAAQKGVLPANASYLSVEPNNILISCMKPAGFPEVEYVSTRKNRSPFIIRLYETHGEESNIWLESTKPVKSVKAVRIDEQPMTRKRDVFREEQFIRTVAHANEILTLQLELAGDREAVVTTTPPAPEENGIIPARYWRLNAGAAPRSFLPVTLSLRGTLQTSNPQEETTVHPMELVLVNNSATESRSGAVEIITPPYWRPIPSRVHYRLEESSYQIVPFQVLMEEPKREGFIKARMPYGSRIIEDIVHIGPMPEFDISMTLRRDSFNITLKHSNPYSLSGLVSIITPIEAWPAEIVGDDFLISYFPRQRRFSIEPGQEAVLSFSIQEPPNRYQTPSDHHWMIVKLEMHYCLRYYHLRMDGNPSEGLGQVIVPPYESAYKPE